MGCLAQRSCFLQNGILNLKSCFMFIQWIISEQVLVMCWGYSGQKERPVPCPQEFAFHWGLEKGSRNKWMMIIWECNQSYEGCARGSLEVAVGNCLRVVCVRGQESSRGDVKSERSQLFEQEGQEQLTPKSSIPGHGKSKLEVCVAETLQLRESCETKSCRAFCPW